MLRDRHRQGFPGLRDAAWVGVLDDGDGGNALRVEFRHAFESGVGIVEVVVGERLALHLARAGDTDARARGIKHQLRALVRIFAVAELRALGILRRELGAIRRHAGKPGRNRAIIGRRMPIGLGRELLRKMKRVSPLWESSSARSAS